MVRQTSQEGDMRFLFVPYQSSQKSSGAVSQQQHAAREFHRKARQRQVKFSKRASSADKEERQAKESVASYWPGRQSFPISDRAVDLWSPTSALLGAGRLDPFNVYCKDKPALNVHEMLDHALSYQWSVFRFSKDEAGLNAIKADVMKCAMTTPVSWYTVIYAGATHYAFNQKGAYSPKFNELLRLSYKTNAIKCMREEISRSDGFASDEVLLSMVTLAAHGGGGDVPKMPNLSKSWTTSILSTAHNIDYYGGMETGWEHMRALVVLVARRGGLDQIKLKGAAIAIQLYDAFTSWRLFRRPMFPLLQPTSYFMGLRAHTPDKAAISLSQQLGGAFSLLQIPTDYAPLQSLLQAVTHTTTLTVDLDQWQRKTPHPPDYVHLQFTRWCILHDLLSLPDLSSSITENDDNAMNLNLIYEMIRLSTFAYLLFTLMPIPEAGSLPSTLADKLRFVLDACISLRLESSVGPCVEHPSLFLWAVVMGGMCAYAAASPVADTSPAPASTPTSPLLDAYAEYTQQLSVKAEVHAWPLVVDLLGRYLWYEAECNELGETFWRHACGIA